MKYPSKIFRNEFSGAPYKFGGGSREEGFDCLSFVVNFYKRLGRIVPDFADLYSLYERDFVKAKRLMWRRLLKVTREISANSVMPGDLVIFRHQEFGNYPGVWLGNGNIGAVFTDTGLTVVDSRGIDLHSFRCWR